MSGEGGDLSAAREYVELVARIHEVYRHLVMDTPEDRALHAKHVETADKALALARAALSSAPTYEAPMDHVADKVDEIELRESIAQAIEALRPPYYAVGNWPNGYRKAVEDAAGIVRGGAS